MSKSKWRSWCRACRSKSLVQGGQDRRAWWAKRRSELRQDGKAMEPNYGPEVCMQCGGKYEAGQFIFHPSVHAELMGTETRKDEEMAATGYFCSSCWYEAHGEENPPDRVDWEGDCHGCDKPIVFAIPATPKKGTYDEDDEDSFIEVAVYLKRHNCITEQATIWIDIPEGAENDHEYLMAKMEDMNDNYWDWEQVDSDPGDYEILEVEVE